MSFVLSGAVLMSSSSRQAVFICAGTTCPPEGDSVIVLCTRRMTDHLLRRLILSPRNPCTSSLGRLIWYKKSDEPSGSISTGKISESNLYPEDDRKPGIPRQRRTRDVELRGMSGDRTTFGPSQRIHAQRNRSGPGLVPLRLHPPSRPQKSVASRCDPLVDRD